MLKEVREATLMEHGSTTAQEAAKSITWSK